MNALALLLAFADAPAQAADYVWYPDTRWVSSLVGEKGSYGRRLEVPTKLRAVGYRKYESVGDVFLVGIDMVQNGDETCGLTLYTRDNGYGNPDVKLGSINRCLNNIFSSWWPNVPETTAYGTVKLLGDGTHYTYWMYRLGLGFDSRDAVVNGEIRYKEPHSEYDNWVTAGYATVGPGSIYVAASDESVGCPTDGTDHWLATGVIARYDSDDKIVGMKLICHLAELEY
jgi:hypothetical protein